MPAGCIITECSTSTSLWQVRIELTTLGLWDLRAASCATATMKVSRSSSVMTQVPNAQLRSKLQDEVLASDTDCRALWYSRTPQRMGARGLPAVVPRWPFGVVQPLSAEWAHDGPHAVPAACIITTYSTSTPLWQVRIELTTLG